LKQELKEARENVSNRMKYISEEIKRQETVIKEMQEKQDKSRQGIKRIQEQQVVN